MNIGGRIIKEHQLENKNGIFTEQGDVDLLNDSFNDVHFVDDHSLVTTTKAYDNII